MKENKLGTYITKLMSTVLDAKSDQFIRELAMNELRRINVDLNDFLRKNVSKEDDNENKEKELLQESEQLNLFEEDKKDG
jgi:predicted metal-dependent enzyme (double-stranded beta helix superfamily)